MSKDNFHFSTDNLLAKSETEDYFEVEGIASTNDADLDNEVVDQNFDLSAIKAGKGYLNDDHSRKYIMEKDGIKIENPDLGRIGVIDEAKVTKAGLWIKGKVWKNHPAGIAYRNELKYKPGLVQFSVEGYTLTRDSRNPNRVTKAFVTGVALTRNPTNPNTFARLAKSLGHVSIETAPVKTVNQEIIKSYQIEKSNQEVKITYILDSTKEGFEEAYGNIFEDLQKGGPGSGKKATGRAVPLAPQHVRNGDEERTKQAHVISTVTDDDKDRLNQESQKREELKRELEAAKEGATSPTTAKQAVKEIKQRRELQRKKRKIIIKKSQLQMELIKRSQQSPAFKKSLEIALMKALTSGGPAYATTLPGNMVDGQALQQESLDSNSCKKCKKDKCKC